MPVRDLHQMLGLNRSCTEGDLRFAYDDAMQRATRSGDFTQAMALSAAFDALPSSARATLFPSVDAMRSVSAGSRGYGGGSPQAWRPAPKPRRGRGLSNRRMALGTWVMCLIAAGIIAAVYFGGGVLGGSTNRPGPARTADPAGTQDGFGPSAMVPIDAKVGADGLASVACQPSPGAAGYIMTVPPGTIIACSNGAIPKVLD